MNEKDPDFSAYKLNLSDRSRITETTIAFYPNRRRYLYCKILSYWAVFFLTLALATALGTKMWRDGSTGREESKHILEGLQCTMKTNH